MSHLSEQLGSMLPDDVPEEMRVAVAEKLGQVSPFDLMALMGDALAARELLDAGDRDGALAVMEPYREKAKAAGLEAIYESMFSTI